MLNLTPPYLTDPGANGKTSSFHEKGRGDRKRRLRKNQSGNNSERLSAGTGRMTQEYWEL
jgi:hypothetical protein